MLNRNLYYSVSILIGTAVGVGIFGIPFSFAKAGFLTGVFFLVILGAVSLIVNLAFGEVILRTEKVHQFTGYAQKYLNSGFKILASFSWFLGLFGALLAYIIISGNFLFNIFISQFYIEPFTYSILFFIFAAAAVLAGLKSVSWFELLMVIFFSLIVILVFISGLPKIDAGNLSDILNQEFWFLPYGVLLFALAGFSAIPTQKEVIKSNNRVLKKAIVWGSLIPVALYLVFSFSVVGVSGDTTSPDVISGLAEFFDYRFIILVSIFGFLTVGTSFLAIAFALIETFRLDYGFKRFNGWALAVFIPFLMFIFGVRNFIEVISLAGSIAIGICGMIMILIYKKAKLKGERIPEYSLNLPSWLLNGIIVLFALGAAYAVFE